MSVVAVVVVAHRRARSAHTDRAQVLRCAGAAPKPLTEQAHDVMRRTVRRAHAAHTDCAQVLRRRRAAVATLSTAVWRSTNVSANVVTLILHFENEARQPNSNATKLTPSYEREKQQHAGNGSKTAKRKLEQQP